MLNIWPGIFGGFIAPSLSRYLRKYKFRYIFVFVTIFTWLGFFVALWLGMGWGRFVARFFTYDVQCLIIPIAFVFGFFSVLVVWLYAPNLPSQFNNNSDGSKEEK